MSDGRVRHFISVCFGKKKTACACLGVLFGGQVRGGEAYVDSITSLNILSETSEES